MANSMLSSMYAINKWAYRYYSRKFPIEKTQPVAWVSSFVPVEILEALDIAYIYPESYAAVIAASGKEQECIHAAEAEGFSLDCCSYSACFNGCLSLGKGPRGVPVQPDILIVSNNQCNTLPNWWNLLSEKLEIPLLVLDYPGEGNVNQNTFAYVTEQHKQLINKLEDISNKKLSHQHLKQLISTSQKNITLWENILKLFPLLDISSSMLFDYISPLIIARCNSNTTTFLELLYEELHASDKRDDTKKLYWAGYPFWYHPARYLPMEGSQIVGADYVSWWNLDYSGDTIWESLYNAYNFTFLNLTPETKLTRLTKDIELSGAQGVVINCNKSCKRNFPSMQESKCPLPCTVIDTDMIDRNFIDINMAKERISLLLSIL